MFPLKEYVKIIQQFPDTFSKKIRLQNIVEGFSICLFCAMYILSTILFSTLLTVIFIRLHPFLFLTVSTLLAFHLLYSFLPILWRQFYFFLLYLWKTKEFDHEICIFCLNSGEMIEYPCKHRFHKSCIKHWILHYKINCPICRKKLIPFGFRFVFKCKGF
jgi:hypothetical protein